MMFDYLQTKLTKVLAVKKEKIQELKDMNTLAEKMVRDQQIFQYQLHQWHLSIEWNGIEINVFAVNIIQWVLPIMRPGPNLALKINFLFKC